MTNPIIDVVAKQLCEDDFYFFCRYFFKKREGSKWIKNWHHDKLCSTLEAISRYEIGNTVFNIPPRYGKTEIVVIMFIAWCIAKNPKAKFIHLSYSDDLALDNSSKIKELIESDEFQALWTIELKRDSKSKKKWYTKEGGGVYAGSTGGAVRGFGAGSIEDEVGKLFGGAIVIDDPIKADKEFISVNELNEINARLNTTISNRRNSHTYTPIIIIMQRVHVNDMAGFVLKNGMNEKFHHVNLPVLDENNKPLWEMRHNVEQLEKLKEADPRVFAGQYMQSPKSDSGNIIKAEWFRRYNTLPVGRVIHSWDTAYKANQHNDPSCLTVWVIAGGVYYLKDVIHGRFEYPELKRKILAYAERDKPELVLLEDKASGQSLIQELRDHLNIIPILPLADKLTRVVACSGAIEAGRVHLPNQAEWLLDFEEELVTFPLAIHDDRVDSTSQFLNYIKTNNSSYVELMREMGYSV